MGVCWGTVHFNTWDAPQYKTVYHSGRPCVTFGTADLSPISHVHIIMLSKVGVKGLQDLFALNSVIRSDACPDVGKTLLIKDEKEFTFGN